MFWVLKNQYCTSTSENWNVWHLAIRVVLLDDTCRNSSIRGAWCLAARVPRQAVWKPFAPGDLCGAPNDFWWSRHCVLLALDVCGVWGFGRYLKGQLLKYSWTCGLGWRVTRAFFKLWHGITSVPAYVLQVMACRLDNNDSLRLSTKDVEPRLHGGGHVWWD